MKKLITLALSLFMCCSMIGCGSSTSSSKDNGAGNDTKEVVATKAEPITLNVAYMPNYGSLWAVLSGIEKGYFNEEGITINLYEFTDGPTIIAAMESGKIDVGYIGNGAHKLCINGKAKIFAMQQVSDGDSVIGLKSRGIKELKDIKGKKVAYSSGSSSQEILLNALTSVGLTMKDIEAYDMDASNMVSAMVSGSVDACATWSPNSLQILKEVKDDSVKLCSNKTFSDNSVSLASWIAMPNYAEKNKDTLVRYTRALYKAMNYGADEKNYEEVAKYVAAKCATDFDKAFSQRGDADWYTGDEVLKGATDGSIEKLYQTQQKSFLASGDVKKEVPVKDYVMLDVMVEAGKK